VGEYITNAVGYVKIDPGLHYLDESGELREAEAVIEGVPGGAVVRKTGLKVFFSSDINSEGSIEIETPEQFKLRGAPIGISYFDPISGNSVLIAELRSSNGKIVGKDKVVYENCFDDVRADAVYEVTKAGVMQMIVLRENIAGPEEYGLSDQSRLEVITEFLNAPQPVRSISVLKGEPDPVKRASMVEPDFSDQQLQFGQYVMPAGVAFATREGASKYRVGKHWQDIPGEGRSVLFEAVSGQAISSGQAAGNRSRGDVISAKWHRNRLPGRHISRDNGLCLRDNLFDRG
jgi:hypothetical protein